VLDDDDPAAEPDHPIDAVEYRPVWQHANAWGGDAYADWFCYVYVADADSLADLPTHSFAWRYFPGEAARGAPAEDGQPFTPAQAAALELCERCGVTAQPEGPWSFDEDDGTSLRAVVCPQCGLVSYQSGVWEPPAWQDRVIGASEDDGGDVPSF
jgi:hypothetical protein